MFSLPAKLLFALSGLAVGLALFYGVDVGERAGVTLLFFLALAAGLAGLAVLGATLQDVAPHVAADAPPPDENATTPGPAAAGSAWPVGAALAAGLIAVGAATDQAIVYAGIGALILASLGWFGWTWAQHRSFTPRIRARVGERLLAPIALPLGMFLLTLVIAGSVSRVLLASSKEASTLVALALAIGLLVVFSVLSLRPRVGSTALLALAGLGVVGLIGAGVGGAAAGERSFGEHAAHEDEVLELEAENVAFSTDTLEAPADKEVELHFKNLDEGVYHNVAIYKGEGLKARPFFNGRGFPGVASETYHFKVPTGEYTFVCDFHANMKGTLTAS
jgi:plastocyanin